MYFFLRDPSLPYKDLLEDKPNINPAAPHPEVLTDYCSEITTRARAVFRICKSFSDAQLLKSNFRLNQGRKFKDIKVGNRVYIKNEVRPHKFSCKYRGPYRVANVVGNTVLVYSLFNKTFKKVNMSKVRHAGSLNQSECESLGQAYPESDPDRQDNED